MIPQRKGAGTTEDREIRTDPELLPDQAGSSDDVMDVMENIGQFAKSILRSMDRIRTDRNEYRNEEDLEIIKIDAEGITHEVEHWKTRQAEELEEDPAEEENISAAEDPDQGDPITDKSFHIFFWAGILRERLSDLKNRAGQEDTRQDLENCLKAARKLERSAGDLYKSV